MELRIMVVLLILNFEILEPFGEFRDMKASEELFRHPQVPYVGLKAL